MQLEQMQQRLQFRADLRVVQIRLAGGGDHQSPRQILREACEAVGVVGHVVLADVR